MADVELSVALRLRNLVGDAKRAQALLEKELSDIEIRINPDLSDLEKSTRRAGDEIDKLKGRTSGLSSFLQGIGQGIGTAAFNAIANGAQAAAGAIAGIANEAIGMAQDFNSAKAALNTLGADGEAVGEALRSLSSEMGGLSSTVDLTQAAYDVLSARTESLTQGLSDAEVATKILDASTRGAVAGFSDVGTVSDALTSTLNSYGLSADHAESVTAKFLATQNAGKITVGQYASQIGRVATTAANAGVSLDELNGLIATATVKGVPVESTFAGIRQAIAAALNPDFAKKAQELGLSVEEADIKSRGLSGILKVMSERGLDTSDNLFKLFGSVEAVTAIIPSTGQGFQSLTANIEASSKALESGLLQSGVEAVAGTVENRLSAASNTAKEAILQLGEGLLPAQAAVTELMSGILSGVVEGTDAFDLISSAAARFTETLQNNPEIVAKLTAAFTEVADVLGGEIAQGMDYFIAAVESEAFSTYIDTFISGLRMAYDVISVVIGAIATVGQVLEPVLVMVLRFVQSTNEGISELVGVVNAVGSALLKSPMVQQLLKAAEAAQGLAEKLGLVRKESEDSAPAGEEDRTGRSMSAGESPKPSAPPPPTTPAAATPAAPKAVDAKAGEKAKKEAEKKQREAEAAAKKAEDAAIAKIDQQLANDSAPLDRRTQQLDQQAQKLNLANELMAQQTTLAESLNALQQQRLQYALEDAEKSGDAVAIQHAQEALFANQQESLERQFATKVQQLAIGEQQQKIDLDRQRIAAQLAQLEAEAEVAKARTAGASQEEISNLQQQVELRRKQVSYVDGAIASQAQSSQLALEQLQVEQQISQEALNRQRAAAVEQQAIALLDQQLAKAKQLNDVKAAGIQNQNSLLQQQRTLLEGAQAVARAAFGLELQRLNSQLKSAKTAGERRQIEEKIFKAEQAQFEYEQIAKARSIDLAELQAELDVRSQELAAQRALLEAKIALAKAKASGASEEEVKLLEEGVGLAEQQLGQIGGQRETNRQAFGQQRAALAIEGQGGRAALLRKQAERSTNSATKKRLNEQADRLEGAGAAAPRARGPSREDQINALRYGAVGQRAPLSRDLTEGSPTANAANVAGTSNTNPQIDSFQKLVEAGFNRVASALENGSNNPTEIIFEGISTPELKESVLAIIEELGRRS